MAIGKLDFYIPGSTTDSTLVFEQNINVSESKAANYAKYDILARPSTIYAYLGAKSRVLKLSFDVLLDHLAAFSGGSSYSFGEMGTESDFAQDEGGEMTGGGAFGTGGVAAESISGETAGTELDHWVDVIRKSVANEGADPTLGPPSVVFNYTRMYKDISCICKDYKITIKGDDKAGFFGNRNNDENRSPRLVSFDLSLEEII